jgi:hypothetical protein
MPNQRVQYGSIVHLFIGTGRSPCKITLMPFVFTSNSIVILRGLIWIFIFKSVPLFCCHAEAFLHITSWTFHPSSWSSSISVKLRLDNALVYPQPDSEDTCSHTWKTLSNYVFEDLRKLKAPNTDVIYSSRDTNLLGGHELWWQITGIELMTPEIFMVTVPWWSSSDTLSARFGELHSLFFM